MVISHLSLVLLSPNWHQREMYLQSPNLIVIGAKLVALTEHDGDLGGIRTSERTVLAL